MPSSKNLGHDQIRQEEMSDMVGAKLGFNSIHGLAKGTGHDCRVVDQDVDLLDASIDDRCSLSYRRLVAEVDADELRLHLWMNGMDTINDGLDLGQGTTSKDN